jgi:hypothetical protein
VTDAELPVQQIAQRPEGMKAFLHKQTRRTARAGMRSRAFHPALRPWEQRLCLIPMATCSALSVRQGKIVTAGSIASIETGIRLEDGAI